MTEETGVVESPQEAVDVADVSTDDLRTMMTETEPAEAAQPDQPETTETPEQPEAVEEETEEERLAKRRIRPKSALDQQVLDLYKSEAFDGSFADASRIIYQQQEAPQQNLPVQGTEDQRPDPLSRYDERISGLSAEVIELEDKVTEAADNLETAEALKLQREITRRELEVQSLTLAKNSELQKRRDTAFNTHRDKAMESRDKALASYPELQDKESLPRKQFDEYVRQAQKNPDYSSIFQSPLWPEIMVREYVAGAQQQMPEAPPQQSPTMGNQAKVLTTGNTAQPANATTTAEQAASNMSQMSNEQLYALLGQDDGRRAPLR